MKNVSIDIFNDPREPWSKEEFEALLRGKSTSYHIHHPFHVMMAEGKLNANQLRGWVANRYAEALGISTELKVQLLSELDPLKRLQIIDSLIGQSGEFKA